MITEATIGGICVALGSVAGVFGVYFKNRGKTNGNGHAPKVCPKHEALTQGVDGVKEDVKEIKATLSTHTETITDIGRSTARIEGLLEGMRDR